MRLSHSCLRAALALAPIAAMPAVASARQAIDLEHVVIAAVAEDVGDIGAITEYESIGFVELTNAQALDTTADICAVAGAMWSDLADGLTILCTVYSLDTCDAAVVASDLSQAFIDAGQFVEDAGYADAADALRAARSRLDDLMSMSNAGLPSAVRTSFDQALGALDGAAIMLDLLDDDTGLQAVIDYVAELRAIGSDEMLIQLQDPADYAWPSGFLDTSLYVTGNYAGKWEETAIAANFELEETQDIFESWETLDASGVVGSLAGAALVGQLHEFGNHLSDGMYLFRDLINGGLNVAIWCNIVCVVDAQCGPCAVTKAAFGVALLNPDEVAATKKAARRLVEIDAARRGATPPATADDVADAAGGALEDLTDKLVARSGHLYIHMTGEICVFSPCFIFWVESECVKVEEWVKVSIPLVQQMTPASAWTNAQWDAALTAAIADALAWCAAH